MSSFGSAQIPFNYLLRPEREENAKIREYFNTLEKLHTVNPSEMEHGSAHVCSGTAFSMALQGSGYRVGNHITNRDGSFLVKK